MDEGRSIQAEPDDLPHSISKAVTVSASARLHFGFLDPSGRSQRPFGSFGLSIDRPVTKLTLKRAGSLKASGPEARRAAQYLSMLAQAHRHTLSYALEIDEAIPPHSGLGSGTQLALAVGAAFAVLEDAKL